MKYGSELCQYDPPLFLGKNNYLFQSHVEGFCVGFSAEIPEAFIGGIHTYKGLQKKTNRLYHLCDHHIHCHSHVHTFICSMKKQVQFYTQELRLKHCNTTK